MVRSRLIARSPVLQIHSHRKKSSDCRWITLFWLQLLAIYESLATVTRIQWSDQSTQKKNCGSTTRAHQFRFTFLALTANSPSTIGQLGSSTCKVNDYFKASTAPFLSPLPFRPLIGATKACRFPFQPQQESPFPSLIHSRHAQDGVCHVDFFLLLAAVSSDSTGQTGNFISNRGDRNSFLRCYARLLPAHQGKP